jgi:hypothetical protein
LRAGIMRSGKTHLGIAHVRGQLVVENMNSARCVLPRPNPQSG